MEDEDGYFGERVAATYDGTSGVFEPGAVQATAAVLAELAGGGRALELAIGTGRIALPLTRRGRRLHGPRFEYARRAVVRRGHALAEVTVLILHCPDSTAGAVA